VAESIPIQMTIAHVRGFMTNPPVAHVARPKSRSTERSQLRRLCSRQRSYTMHMVVIRDFGGTPCIAAKDFLYVLELLAFA
jgi:hypothetical protein